MRMGGRLHVNVQRVPSAGCHDTMNMLKTQSPEMTMKHIITFKLQKKWRKEKKENKLRFLNFIIYITLWKVNLMIELMLLWALP